MSFFSVSHFGSPCSVIHILIPFLLDQKTINEKLFFSLSDSRLTQQNMSTQNRSRNINLLVSCRDALPLSCMRLVRAKGYVLLNWFHVTNIQHTAKTGIAIRAYSQDRNVIVFILRRSFFLSSRLCYWLKKNIFPMYSPGLKFSIKFLSRGYRQENLSGILKTESLDNAVLELWLASPSWHMSHYTMLSKYGNCTRQLKIKNKLKIGCF